ncbi:MAG: chorismate mutase [Clostridia bacterium]
MTLDEIRKQIDEIDDSLAQLIAKRMELVVDVAKFKSENNIAVENKNRESEILARVASKFDDSVAKAIEDIFAEMFDASKKIQAEIVGKNGDKR